MVKANLIPQSTKPLQLNQHFSAPALLGQIREDFGKIPDHRNGGQQFSLQDVLMSGLAVFGLKYPSLLKFDEQRVTVHTPYRGKAARGWPARRSAMARSR